MKVELSHWSPSCQLCPPVCQENLVSQDPGSLLDLEATWVAPEKHGVLALPLLSHYSPLGWLGLALVEAVLRMGG